jgi:hypothetical protein
LISARSLSASSAIARGAAIRLPEAIVKGTCAGNS